MPSLLNKIRAILTRSSHLSPYLPLAREDPEQKVMRLINDKSSPSHGSDDIFIGLYNPKQLDTMQGQNFTQFSSNICVNPMNNWMLFWYFLVFSGLIFYYAETTIVLIYGTPAWQEDQKDAAIIVLNVIFMLIFIADIYVQLNTGYITNSAVILDRRRVRQRYTHYYIYMDILQIVIFFCAIVSRNYNLMYAKLVIVLKFLRMFEMDGIIERKFTTDVTLKTVYVISKQIVTIFILAHTIGILFYLYDYNLLQQPVCAGSNSAFCWLNSCTAWTGIIELKWTLHYFYSLYWGINTICQISYGDIAPNNPMTVPYALACMCIGSVTYTYIVNNIVKAIIWANQYRDQFRVNLSIFDTYMSQLQVPIQEQYEIVQFLKQRYKEQKNRDLHLEDLMKSKLPEDMKIQLVKNAYSHIIQGLEFFFGQSSSVMKILFGISQKQYGRNERIIMQGSPLNNLAYMFKGEVILSCEYNTLQYGIANINIPDTFVAIYEFFLSHRSSYSISTKQNTIMYFIPREIFEEQSDNDIDFKQVYHVLQYDLLIRQRINKIFYSCYFCGKHHDWRQCETIFPVFNEVTLLKNKMKTQSQGIRVVNVKHRTWRDYKKLSELRPIFYRNKDKELSLLEKRIFALKKRLENREERFQVDTAYDWPSYLSNQNLTRLKEMWNMRRGGRRSSFIGTRK